ncbi:MAG: alpha/beta hydrolase [Pseudomonadota bacterium]
MTFAQVTSLTTADGAQLAVRQLQPSGTPKAIIHINHGMAEHSLRYARFADALAGADYGVVAHDHRGHGETTAPDAHLGHFGGKDGWDRVMGDVMAVNRFAREANPDVPIIVFGHSMGAIIAFNHTLREPDSIAGAALWNAGVENGPINLVFNAILKTQRFFRGSDVPSPIAKKLTFETWNKEFAPNRTDFDWLSRDEREVDLYVHDPLCGFDVSIALWLSVLEGVAFAADDKKLAHLPKDLAVHLLAGEKDPCSEHGKAVAHIEQRMKSTGMQDVTFNLLADTRHESLNEINRDQTTADFIAWLDTRFG